MGSVLSFRPRAAPVPRKRNPAGTAASIIIFPGVRYERQLPMVGATSVALVRSEVRQELPKSGR